MSTPGQSSPSNEPPRKIRTLSGMEAIRYRSAMYAGTPPDAIYHLLDEVLDNSAQEAMAGYCDQIAIALHADGSITVLDNGRGIPVQDNLHHDTSMLEIALTWVTMGGHYTDYMYHVWGGFHGIGPKVTNALSEWMIVEVRRDGYLWRLSLARGAMTSEITRVRPLSDGETTGTSMTFLPDAQIFPGVRQEYDYQFDIIADRCRDLAYLLPGCTLRVTDERVSGAPREVTFLFEDGLSAYVHNLNRTRTVIHPIVHGSATVNLGPMYGGDNIIEIDFAFQYTDDAHTTEHYFVNTIETPDGGTHRTGFRTALTRTINQLMRKAGILEHDQASFTGHDTLKGLTAVLSIKHRNPEHAHAIRNKLANPEVKGLVEVIVAATFAEQLTPIREQTRLFLQSRHKLLRR